MAARSFNIQYYLFPGFAGAGRQGLSLHRIIGGAVVGAGGPENAWKFGTFLTGDT